MIHWTVNTVMSGPAGPGYAAVAVGRSKLYVFEVFCDAETHTDDNYQIDMHVLDTFSLRWVTLLPAGTSERGHGGHLEDRWVRKGHTAVLIEGSIYIWGGYATRRELNLNTFPIMSFKSKGTFECSPRSVTVLRRCRGDVLYAFDVDAHRWFKPESSGTVPEGRGYPSACVLGKVMFICGGWTGTGEYTHDTYKLDTTTMVWSLINTRETPSSSSTWPSSTWSSATIIGTKMFVLETKCHSCFEFSSGQRDCVGIRVFDTETNCWLSRTPSLPPPLYNNIFHSAFAYKGELYVFGGKTSSYTSHSDTFKDLWRFNQETDSWTKSEPQGKRGTAGMSCLVGDRIVLLGGSSQEDDDPPQRNPHNTLCVLDLSPSLKTLCKLAVVGYDLDQSELPHNIRFELAAIQTFVHN